MSGALGTPERVEGVRARFDSVGIDAFLVTKAPNLRWLTGFSGSNGLALVTNETVTLVTDARYGVQAAAETATMGFPIEVRITNDPVTELTAGTRTGMRLGIEADDLSVARFQTLDAALDAELMPVSAVVETLRRHKTEAEIALLAEAADMADRAFHQIWGLIGHDLAPGTTERRVAAELDHLIRLAGADGPSFDTIVASGPNGAKPHSRPGDRVLEPGDLVVLDFGARVGGYGSDMTRTVVAGGCPSRRQLELYEAVRVAQQAGVDAVADGVPEVDIDRACRTVLAERGLGDAFTHGTGHGIGLEIHEQPILSTRSVGILHVGLVITVEPGIYLPDFGGIRVEDSVVVTDGGCTPITHSPKGLVPVFQESGTK